MLVRIKKEKGVFRALIAGNSHNLHTAPETDAFCQEIHLTESHFCQSVLKELGSLKGSVALDELAVQIRTKL